VAVAVALLLSARMAQQEDQEMVALEQPHLFLVVPSLTQVVVVAQMVMAAHKEVVALEVVVQDQPLQPVPLVPPIQAAVVAVAVELLHRMLEAQAVPVS
jgi:hypothetical protein